MHTFSKLSSEVIPVVFIFLNRQPLQYRVRQRYQLETAHSLHYFQGCQDRKSKRGNLGRA